MPTEPVRILDGRYELVAPLGVGASGTTWRARRVEDGVEVAVKERLVAHASSFRELDRLKREAAFLAELDHPRIPKLVEHAVVEDGPRIGVYLVSELVEGATLGAEIRDGAKRCTLREAMLDLAGILDVLAYLHERAPAVVHGDVKPDNLVRRARDGALVLVDFHAARMYPAEIEVGLTTAIGTPGFLAPEQLAGRSEPATDIYAAACVAIALLTRRPLHTLVDDRHRLRWREAIAVPEGVERLLARMLEPSLARRARDARALAADARALAKGRARSPRRRWILLGLASAGVALGMAPLLRTAPPAAPPDGDPPAAPPDGDPPATVHVLHFPDVPGSACEARRSCVPLDQGAVAAAAFDACGRADPVNPSKEAQFTIDLAGMTPFCHAQILGRTCMASCVFRFRDIDADAFQERAEHVAQALRDVHGNTVITRPWSTRALPSVAGMETSTSISRSWSWTGQDGWRFDVTAQWRPIPRDAEAPNDVYLSVWMRMW
jgi:hypothetical protein